MNVSKIDEKFPRIFFVNGEIQTIFQGMATGKDNQKLKGEIRDRLIIGELPDLQSGLPSTCKLTYDDPDILHQFSVSITPDEGHWLGGRFKFHLEVPEEYNFVPPKVKCLTKIWHPNISEDGAICLSILRQPTGEDTGWNPARRLIHVIWGLNSLFTDLLNFDDPLNTEASLMYKNSPEQFQLKVDEYIRLYTSLDD